MSQTQQITIDKSLLELCLLTLNEKPNYMSKCGRNSYDIAVEVETALKGGVKLKNHQKEKRVLEDIITFMQKVGYPVQGAWDGEERILHSALEDIRSGRQPVSHLVQFITAAERGTVHFTAPNGQVFSIHIMCGNLPLEVIWDMSGEDDDTMTAGTAIVEARLRYLEVNASWL